VNNPHAEGIDRSLMRDWQPLYRSRLHYLITWSTRARRPVLKTRHSEALEALIRGVCEESGFGLVEVVASQDHVHVLIGLKPAQSVASAIRELKGRSSVTLLERFPELRVWLRGNLVWDERFSVETVSPAQVDRLRERLLNTHRSADQGELGEGFAAAS